MKIKHIENLQTKLDEKVNNSSILNEIDLISNSQTHIPTQYSVKSYVDNLYSNTSPKFIDVIDVITNITINSNTVYQYNLSNAIMQDTEPIIYLNGLVQRLNIDYTIASNVLIEFIFVFDIDVSDVIEIIYKTEI